MGYSTGLTGFRSFLIISFVLILLSCPAAAFGAGNIASISKIEGHNYRHGDIEDMLKTVAFLKGHKWTSMMVKRAYFGNWLRDYSQAVDVGTLKGVQSGTIRILVWVLSFLSFGYATGEFEVTEERLGVYRPEEHIDNPKDYADNLDARQYDQRLRPPVMPEELQIDPDTGMKNYIANESGGWATSAGYIKFSFARSIHFGRVYTSGASGTRGKDADLCEALRCLGQGLHCCEDFGAHTNYTELTLRELGFHDVFTHTGSSTEMSLRGHRVFPLVTGTFGAVDFLHSVLGEATDHFAQTEVEELDNALGDAQTQSKKSSGNAADSRGFTDPGQQVQYMTSLLSQIPGGGSLCSQAEALQGNADAQEFANMETGTGGREVDEYGNYRASGNSFAAPPGSIGGPPGPGIPGMSPDFDPMKTAAQIYPILEFRDKVVKAISMTIEKIPGLEALVEKITETLTLFVLSLLAPYIRPIINAVSAQLKQGSSTVVNSSANHQYEPWTDPHCTDPTHSLLSKDHFSNILNEPAGKVAGTILQYVAPRIIYAWGHPDVPEHEVLGDIVRVFHHPAIRDPHCEIQRNMFDTVQRWVHSRPDRGANLNDILSSEGVRNGRNHKGDGNAQHSHGGGLPGLYGQGSHSKTRGSEWEKTKRHSNQSDQTDNTVIGTSGVQISQQYQQDPYSEPLPPVQDLYAPPISYQQGYHDPYQTSTSTETYSQAGYSEYPPPLEGAAYGALPYQHEPNAPQEDFSGGNDEYGRPAGHGGGGGQYYNEGHY
ncbi:MAG: hypothetical protein M1827_002406 [Pycnora praestabilis]|nr:MAG: hypothetical protein M1827_002406 [Pycnora praestabilis]